jgi:hypothetical protein
LSLCTLKGTRNEAVKHNSPIGELIVCKSKKRTIFINYMHDCPRIFVSKYYDIKADLRIPGVSDLSKAREDNLVNITSSAVFSRLNINVEMRVLQTK